MKRLISGLVMGVALLAAPAYAHNHTGDEDAAHAHHYSTTSTTIGELMDNPETLVVFETHLPDVVSHPQIDMGRGMTLKEAQSFEPGLITDEKLAAMDEDLAEIEK